MSEFSFIKDPIRENIFAIVVKSDDDAEIYPFSERAKSWANSQFGIDITPPDGMIMSEYRNITPKIKSIIAEIEQESSVQQYVGIDLKKLISPVYRHQKRVRIKTSPHSSNKRINKFSGNSRNLIIDFKAKKFASMKRRSELSRESNGLSKIDSNTTALFGTNSIRRAKTSQESSLLDGASTKRSARRVKSLVQGQEINTQASNRISDSILAKTLRFRAQ